jgi:hypothetical protein
MKPLQLPHTPHLIDNRAAGGGGGAVWAFEVGEPGRTWTCSLCFYDNGGGVAGGGLMGRLGLGTCISTPSPPSPPPSPQLDDLVVRCPPYGAAGPPPPSLRAPPPPADGLSASDAPVVAVEDAYTAGLATLSTRSELLAGCQAGRAAARVSGLPPANATAAVVQQPAAAQPPAPAPPPEAPVQYLALWSNNSAT